MKLWIAESCSHKTNELISTLSRNMLHLEPFAPVIAPNEPPTSAEEKTHDHLSFTHIKKLKTPLSTPCQISISSEIDNNKLLLMGRTRFNPLLMISAFLVLMHTLKSEFAPPTPNPRTPAPFHPFCISQFALANHACASVAYGPVSHPFSAQNDSVLFDKLSHGGHHSEGHEHRHHRRRRHNHHHNLEAEAAKECCRWMKAIDDFCICDMLIRLPNFLSRPVHRLMVVIDDGCKVVYKCPGRLLTTP